MHRKYLLLIFALACLAFLGTVVSPQVADELKLLRSEVSCDSVPSRRGELSVSEWRQDLSPCADDFSLQFVIETREQTGQILDASGEPFDRQTLGLIILITPPGMSCFGGSHQTAPGGIVMSIVSDTGARLDMCSSTPVNDGIQHVVRLEVPHRGTATITIDGHLDQEAGATLPGRILFPRFTLGCGEAAPRMKVRPANAKLGYSLLK